MTDDWMKKYFSQNAWQQISQQNTPSQQNIPKQDNDSGWKEVDIQSQLTNRIYAGNMLGQYQQQTPQQTTKTCFLREGYPYYKQIQGSQGFGNMVSLVKTVDNLTGISGRQFVVKGELTAYCVDDLTSIDLAKLAEQYPERQLFLVKVAMDMMTGDILVPRAAIIENNSNGVLPQYSLIGPGNKQILKG